MKRYSMQNLPKVWVDREKYEEWQSHSQEERKFHDEWKRTFTDLAKHNMLDIGHDPHTITKYTPQNVSQFISLYKQRRKYTFSKGFLDFLYGVVWVGFLFVALSFWGLQHCVAKKDKGRSSYRYDKYEKATAKRVSALLEQRDRLIEKIELLESNNAYLFKELDVIELQNKALLEKIEQKQKSFGKRYKKSPNKLSEKQLKEACLESTGFTFVSKESHKMLLKSYSVNGLYCVVTMPHSYYYTPTTFINGVKIRKGKLYYRVPPTYKEAPTTDTRVIVDFESISGFMDK